MPRSSYDVIVVGRELSATVAGALLLQRGLRVLCVSGPGDPSHVAPPAQGPPVSDRYNLGPYVLPTAPMPLVAPEAPAIRKIVAELNLVQLFRRRIEQNRPAFQVLLPDARLDVDDDLARALEREAPAALPVWERAQQRVAEVSAQVESILSEETMLPPDGFWDRRDGKRVAARLPDDGEDLLGPLGELDATGAAITRALARLPARFGCDLSSPGAIAGARAADLWQRGTYRIDGGRDGLRALFVDRLRALGGEYRPELRIERVLVKRGRVAGIDVGAPEGEIGCDQLVAGIEPAQLTTLFGGDRPARRLAESGTLRPALHRYVLHLVVPLDVLPDALGRVAFSLRDPDGALGGANALLLHLQDGYGQHAVLSAEALTADVSPEGLAGLRREMREHLDALLPFVERHVLCIHSPHDGLPPEGVSDPAPPPRPLEPLWPIDAPRLLGVCGLPYDTGLRGLWLAGRVSLPGLGVEGELEASLRVARLCAAAAGKREASGTALRG